MDSDDNYQFQSGAVEVSIYMQCWLRDSMCWLQCYDELRVKNRKGMLCDF